MEPYKFVEYNPFDEVKPNLPPKGLGDCFRYMVVSFKDGTVFKGHNIYDVYMRALKHIGLEKAAKSAYFNNIQSGGAPIVSKQISPNWNSRYKCYEIDGYHVLKIKGNSYRALLNKLSEEHNLGISVELI